MDERTQEAIFDQWLKEHRGVLFKVVHAHAFTAHDREDLFQEISTQVWNSIPRFRSESAVTTWLYRVALNTALAWTRNERRHHRQTFTLDSAESTLKDACPKVHPRLEWLYEQIAQLDHFDRALTLLMLDGLSYREIAETLGITQNYAGVRLNRIKAKLIDRSKEEEHHGF
jgi:RNA polymerase sigma-70 factor (ECF subfamily)